MFACGAGVPFDDAKTSKRQSVKGNEPETTRPGEAFETRADSRDVVGGFAPTTTFSKMLAERLDDVENKRALVMESTVRMLTPDEGSFENLSEQMVAYAPYGELVLARAAKAILDETARKPAFALAYGSLLERLVKRKCVACPPSHFRRVLLLAVEDAGVRLLKRQEDAAHRRALETLGWARYQRGIAGGAGTHASFYDAIVDRESYAEYEAFRNECKALQGILRDLYEHRNLLLPDDLQDVAAGFPGSEHSVGVSDAAAAWRKATFFRGLTRWRSAGDDAAADATRAGADAWLGHERRGLSRLAEGDEATVVKQRGVGDADPPVPRRGVEGAHRQHMLAIGHAAAVPLQAIRGLRAFHQHGAVQQELHAHDAAIIVGAVAVLGVVVVGIVYSTRRANPSVKLLAAHQFVKENEMVKNTAMMDAGKGMAVGGRI